MSNKEYLVPMDEDLIAKLHQISTLDSEEEQGYQAAFSIIEMTGKTPEEVLVRLFATPSKGMSVSDAKRNIGVVRWCLDQREKSNGQ